MTVDWQMLLGRAHRDIDAAGHLASGRFNEQAISRAYFAAFLAAEAALAVVGESSSTHAGVMSSFGKRIVREGGLESRVAQILRALFELRGDADYRMKNFSADQAAQSVRDAAAVVEAVEQWIAQRG